MTRALRTSSSSSAMVPFWKSWVLQWYEKLAWESRFDALYLTCLFVGESLLCYVIIVKVPYTEIDWQAYMEEVDGYEQGERDYLNIRGGTGPLVYPAGFLYLFSALKSLTVEGTDIRAAQYIFAIAYLLTQFSVWRIYQKAIHVIRQKHHRRHLQQQQHPPSSSSSSSSSLVSNLTARHEIWSWRVAMACTCLSKRVHSIFILRLFNDGPTMLFLYMALILFTGNKWNAGCLIFSLAVSLKMNVLLFAPGLLLLLLQVSENLPHVVYRLFVFCALPQLILGSPFLLTYPISYLRKAFELDRVFFYQWTVNWKFLPEDIFVSKPLSVLLLLLHIGGLGYFCRQWIVAVNRATGGKRIFFLGSQSQLSPIYITSTMFVSNYIGICFARTLHYQFYSWYFHALPYLLWCNSSNSTTPTAIRNEKQRFSYPFVVRIALLLAIELSFLTFPATPLSSAILQLAHMAILVPVQPPDLFWIKDDPVQEKKGR